MNTQKTQPTYKAGLECHAVGFHIGMHDEEAAGAAYLFFYGNKMHPGIANAIQEERFVFVNAGALTYNGKNWKQCHEEDGIVFIGTMGSPYDEHYLPEEVRRKECSATLIAKALGIENEFQIKPVMQELLHSDRQSEGRILSFSSHIMRGHKFFGTKDIARMKAMATWAIQPFQWLIDYQNNMVGETREELQKCCTYEDIQYLGRTIRIALIKSDNTQIVSLAKTKAGVSANVVICKNSKGNYYISTSKFPFINLTDVAAELLMEEMDVQNIKYDLRDKKLLTGGPYKNMPWHFQNEENAHRIFNGSLSAPDVTPSKIPTGRVFGTVYRVLKNTQQQVTAVIRKIA